MSKMIVGVLGNGQLAQMLADEVKPGKPLAELCSVECFPGSLSDAAAIREFTARVDILTFENEHVNFERVAQSMGDTPAFPFVPVMRFAQNKLLQKRLFEGCKIPTAKFVEVDGIINDAEAEKARQVSLERAEKKLGLPLVLKWAILGYDGHGVFVHKSDATRAAALSFITEAHKRGNPVYAEEFIAFDQELAMVCAFGANEQVHYPLVVSKQDRGICSEVYGPASAFGTSEEAEAMVQEYLNRLGRSLDFRGILALELFQTPRGIFANELAPRVHNSGHYSQDASECSQFENHLRAVIGAPLKKPQLKSEAFYMLNVLAAEKPKEAGPFAMPNDVPGATLHWYGKSELRPRRKMGHYNVQLGSVDELSDARSKLRACLAEWHRVTSSS